MVGVGVDVCGGGGGGGGDGGGGGGGGGGSWEGVGNEGREVKEMGVVEVVARGGGVD